MNLSLIFLLVFILGISFYLYQKIHIYHNSPCKEGINGLPLSSGMADSTSDATSSSSNTSKCSDANTSAIQFFNTIQTQFSAMKGGNPLTINPALAKINQALSQYTPDPSTTSIVNIIKQQLPKLDPVLPYDDFNNAKTDAMNAVSKAIQTRMSTMSSACTSLYQPPS